MIRRCLQCGKELEACPSQIKKGGGKYCSYRCMGLARHNKMTIICAQCGEKFEVIPSRIKRGEGKYCGQKCYGLSKRNKIIKVCLQCGEEFEIHPSEIKKGGGKYCGIKCARLAGRNRITTICKQCGEEFKLIPSRIKKNRGQYCGVRCMGLARSGPNCHFYKDGHCYDRQGKYQSPEWKKLAKQVRKFDDYTCLACGKKWKKGMRTFVVHHYDENYENDSFLNLLTLCLGCHRKVHCGKISIGGQRCAELVSV